VRVRVHVLRLHAGYRCRHAGVCCTEGWPIPIEAPLYARLDRAIVSRRLQVDAAPGIPLFETANGLPHGEPVVAGRDGRACVFFEPLRGRLCGVQRQLGHDYLPSSCQHFPRVVTLDPRGIFMSLSHLCPTAARMLFDPCDAAFEMVGDGPVVAPGLRWEGLDARDALPPQVSEGILWDWEALTRWEQQLLGLLATRPAEWTLAVAASAARILETWRAGSGPTLAEAVDAAFAAAVDSASCAGAAPDVLALDALARRAAAGGGPSCSSGTADDERLVAPEWARFERAVARYLAARVVANWVGHHTASARAWVGSMEVAYSVLRAEAARHAARSGRPLDRELFEAAAADADRLLVHRMDAARLARALDSGTGLPSQTWP
jgi:hypothetical protein